jgi:hypothetical protein
MAMAHRHGTVRFPVRFAEFDDREAKRASLGIYGSRPVQI